MKKKAVRILTALLAVIMIAGAFAACGKEKKEPAKTSQTNGASAPETNGAEDSEVDKDVESVTLNIGSYNIANGREVDHQMIMLAKDIVDKKLDIVGLEEVDQNCTRSGSIDTMKILSELTGYKYYAFFKAINLQGGEYGSAILSKYPIIESKRIELETGNKEDRVLGRSAIDVNGTTINFFVTHLSYESDSLRANQFLFVNEIMKKHDKCILVGDFNISSLSEYRVLDNMGVVNSEESFVYTFPSKKTCIDNIVYSLDDFTFQKPGYLPNEHSDHNMIYATCEMRPSSLASGATIVDKNGKELSKLSDGMKKTFENVGKWAKGTDGCYIELDLGYDYNLSSLTVINATTCKNVYKWTAFASADPTLPIEKWTKIGEKTDESTATGAGYTVEISDTAKEEALRFVRIYGTYNSNGEDYPIAEVAIFGKKTMPKMTDISSQIVLTDQNGKKITTLNDRLLTASFDLGNWAKGTDGCYLEIDMGEATLLHALNLTQPTSKNGRVYKWTAYATDDNTKPIDQWTVVGEKTNEEVSGDTGYTVILTKNVKEKAYRYIRIYGTFCNEGANFEVLEAYVYGMAVSDLNNLMMDATVTGGNGDTYSILNDGSTAEYEDLGFWAANVAGPAYGIDGTCYVEIDLGKMCNVETLKVVNLVSASRTYKWDAYVTDDLSKPISSWKKIGGKTDNNKSTADGYTLTLTEAQKNTPIRYIRIYGTYHSANCGYHVSEITITGVQAK